MHLAALLPMDAVDSSGWRNPAARGIVQLLGHVWVMATAPLLISANGVAARQVPRSGTLGASVAAPRVGNSAFMASRQVRSPDSVIARLLPLDAS
jgi:hypothetical protein